MTEYNDLTIVLTPLFGKPHLFLYRHGFFDKKVENGHQQRDDTNLFIVTTQNYDDILLRIISLCALF